MKHIKIAALAAALSAVGIAACSTSGTDRFISRVTNFNRGVAAVDAAIAQTSQTLYKNCTNLQAVGQAAVDVTGSCNKASPVVDTVNDVIVGYCSAAPASGIATAISTTASTVNLTKTQLASAKQACAKGGG